MAKMRFLSRKMLLLFFLGFTTKAQIDNCLPLTDFLQKHSKELNRQNIFSLINSQKVHSQALSKLSDGEIIWTDGKKKTKLIAKIIGFNETPKEIQALNKMMKTLVKLKEKPFIVDFKGCFITNAKIFTGEKSPFNSPKNTESNKTLYLLEEKPFGDFSESNNSDSPLNLIGNLSPIKRLKVYLKVSQALYSLHKENVFHGNLRPSAIVTISKSLSHIKLRDFDNPLLKTASKNNENGPEDLFIPIEGFDAENEKNKNESFDIFSFGMTIGVMEFGGKIFEVNKKTNEKVNSRYEIVEANVKLLKEKLKDSPELKNISSKNDSLSDIIIDCLKIRPEERIGSKELVQRLKALSDFLKNKNQNAVFKDKGKTKPHKKGPSKNKDLAKKQNPDKRRKKESKGNFDEEAASKPKMQPKDNSSAENQKKKEALQVQGTFDKKLLAKKSQNATQKTKNASDPKKSLLKENAIKEQNGDLGESNGQAHFVVQIIGGIGIGLMLVLIPVFFVTIREDFELR